METQEQATRLTELGCPYSQGFLFSRPMAAELIRAAQPDAVSARPIAR